MIEACDFNNDGTIDTCEVHTCVLEAESRYRTDFCPGYGDLYCDCPFYVVPCEDAWNCYDVMAVTDEFMISYDTNGDFVVDDSDMFDDEHYNIMMESCDFN